MDLVKEKFENFKKFLQSTVQQENTFLTLFYNSSLDFFLSIVKSKKASGVGKEQLLNEVFQEAQLNKENYKKEDIDKLEKYFDYFMQVVDHIN